MSFDELIVFLVSIYFTFKIFGKWYTSLIGLWPNDRSKEARIIFQILPMVSFIINLIVLTFLASYDVIGRYVVMYLFLGFTWIGFSLRCMHLFFDLSWRDDALELDNKAALYAVSGGFIGTTIIYAGANIGDGSGWWCVIFAGGLGFVSFIILPLILNLFTSIFERITIERNIGVGIRFGFFLISIGIILGRGVAGDWTSFSATVVEFMDAWPVLVLTVLVILIEKVFQSMDLKIQTNQLKLKENYLGSVFWGLIYLLLAILSVLLIPPLRENPMYELAFGGLLW